MAPLVLTGAHCTLLNRGLAGTHRYTIARRDFICWPRGAGVMTSLAYRCCGKVFADFTGFLEMRLPAHLGGAYWTANMVREYSRVSGVLARCLRCTGASSLRGCTGTVE